MNDQHQEERRRSERFPFREDILIDGARLYTSNEISEGGLFVSAIQIFEEGEVIDVTIPFEGEQITVKGQVKYCQPGIGMGVMFHNLTDEQKAKIKKLVDRVSGGSS
jgi:Tfp pilus assembly protein PilZ